jgi:Cu/Ag efflux protein CusF
MRTPFVAAVMIGCTLIAGGAFAQERPHPLPLSTFVDIYTDQSVTSAQKEVGLKEGTWYEGTATVTDVDYYQNKGTGEPFAEIKDVNYRGGCYLLLFRVVDTAKALTLKVGDKVVVRGRLSNIGMYTTKYVTVCETRFALFKDCEILNVLSPGK